MPRAFTTEDYLDLSRLLSENPELRADLRRLVLTDDILDLPAIVRDLAAAQQRTEKRVDTLALRIEELTARVDTLTARLEELAVRVDELAAAQQRTEKRLEELAAAQQRTEERIEELAAAQQHTDQRLEALIARVDAAQERNDQHFLRLDVRVGSLSGKVLEAEYRDKATSFFGAFLRRVRRVDLSDLDAVGKTLTRAEFGDLLKADVVVTGKVLGIAEAPQVDLVAEVSVTIDRTDIERAVRRAGYLRRAAGRPAVPVVAGEAVTDGAEAAAREQKVLVLYDGRHENWEAAAREWAGAVIPPE